MNCITCLGCLLQQMLQRQSARNPVPAGFSRLCQSVTPGISLKGREACAREITDQFHYNLYVHLLEILSIR